MHITSQSMVSKFIFLIKQPFGKMFNKHTRCSISHFNLSTTAFPLRERNSFVTLSVKQAMEGANFGLCNVNGWVRNTRFQKKLAFIEITDGLSAASLQLVVPSELVDKSVITYGASIHAEGELMKSPAKGQAIELKASSLSVIGTNDTESYPFAANTNTYSSDYTRQYLHLRARQPGFAALLRLRNSSRRVICGFFENEDFVHIDTPIFTGNDCEGGGEVFSVQPWSSGHNSETHEGYFGRTKTHLTTSGQLHLEAICSGISKVYSFGPTFRADNAVDRTHLAEFYMVEAEIAFIERLPELTDFIEITLKRAIEKIVESNQDDLDVLHTYGNIDENQHKQALDCITRPFHHLTYTDAVKLLTSSTSHLSTPPQWGDDLNRQHEHLILQAHDNIPVFITNWPKKIKPFYALINEDEETVAAVDLIVPGPGELFGGSLREHRYEILKQSINQQRIEDLNWYLELRKYGSVPHGGFGLGFERFLQFLFGVKQIRDTLPFPRYARNCKL